MKYIFSLIFILSLQTMIFSQISGTVLDSVTKKPIENVNIVSSGTGTITNQNGEFMIDIQNGAKLKFSHIGYKETTEPAKNKMFVYLNRSFVQLSEIIVKSGFNEESYFDAAKSITVMQKKEIRESGANHLQEMLGKISNLNWSGGTSRPRYFQIRGVGERSHYFGEGPPNFSIGYMMDDIDLSGIGMIGQLFDLDQIEVYKGPQSSVYGSNSIGGLVTLKSVDPAPNNDFEASITAGNDSLSTISALLNLKIYKNLFIRISSNFNYSNGFRDNKTLNLNNTNKKDEFFRRIKLLYEPNNNLKILATIIEASLDNGYDAWAPDNNEKFITYSDDQGEDSQYTNAASVRLNLELGSDTKITSISSLSNTNLIHAYDGDWANDDYWLNQHGFDPDIEGWNYRFFDRNDRERENFIQELRLLHKKYTFGLYYKQLTEEDYAEGYLFGGLADEAFSKYDFTAFAGYVQLQFTLTKKATIDFNLRLEENEYRYSGRTIDNYYFTNLPNVDFERKDLMMGYKFAMSFKQSDKLNYFFTHARGYKAGGVNQQPFLNNLNRPFQPEYLDNFEFGLKFLKNKLFLSSTLFYGLRSNQQVSISSQQEPGNPNSFYFFTGNTGKGKVYGSEFDLRFDVLPNLSFNSSVGALRTFVEKFSYQTNNGEEFAGGRQAAMAPGLTGSLGFKYSLGESYITSNTSFKSKYYFSDSHNERSKEYSLTDLTLGRQFQKFHIKLWVRNVFDTRYTIRGFYFGLIPPDYREQLWKSFGDPRHFGFTLNLNFN